MSLDHISDLPEVREYLEWRGAHRMADAALAAADREVGRLKCCGNCDHHEYWGAGEDCEAVNGAVLVACFDPCHFTPSRWTRGET